MAAADRNSGPQRSVVRLARRAHAAGPRFLSLHAPHVERAARIARALSLCRSKLRRADVVYECASNDRRSEPIPRWRSPTDSRQSSSPCDRRKAQEAERRHQPTGYAATRRAAARLAVRRPALAATETPTGRRARTAPVRAAATRRLEFLTGSDR